LCREWLITHPFHAQALYIAGRLGGGLWQIAYWQGNEEVVSLVGQAFSFFGAFYALPQNEMPLTATQLIEVLNGFMGAKK
jgi:hypothetical protein